MRDVVIRNATKAPSRSQVRDGLEAAARNRRPTSQPRENDRFLKMNIVRQADRQLIRRLHDMDFIVATSITQHEIVH